MVKTLINGIHLAYSDQGQGTPLVFIHAFPLSRAMWHPQVQVFAKEYRVITVDLRGHGESDAPMWRYTLDQFADDLNALLAHLSLSQAVFIGLSMGGYILMTFSRKYPDKTKALVFADTRAQADTEEGRAGRFAMAQTAYKDGPEAIADLMLPKLLSQTSRESKPELVETVRRIIVHNHISGIIGDLMAMAERPDSTPFLQEMTCPTLVVVGEDDIATPPPDAEWLVKHLPNAQLARIPAAGHLSNLEQPEAFNHALAPFLRTVESS